MTGQEIVREVKALGLPEGAYIVFGSCTLAAVGIRDSQDIDLLISEELDERLHSQGWKRMPSADDDRKLAYGDFDTHTNWRIGEYDPSLEELLKTAVVVDGIPFGALEEVRIWKSLLSRPKDVADIELIDEYLTRAQTPD